MFFTVYSLFTVYFLVPISMAPVPIYSSNPINSQAAKIFCQIVGFVCLVGFFIDLLTLLLPPNLFSVAWRIGVSQQLGDRSIVLLFGVALSLYGAIDSRRWLKPLALACLVIGSAFLLSSILIIRDGLTYQQQALATISSQATQLQTRIQEAQKQPELPQNVTLEQLQQASQQISTQAEALKQSTRSDVTKRGFSSVGNLAAVGLGLIGLGRCAMRFRRSRA